MQKRLSFGFVASLSNILTDGLVGLIVIPLLLKYQTRDHVGIWLYFLSFNGLLMLCQLGLALAVIRAVAYELKGKTQLTISHTLKKEIKQCYKAAIIVVLFLCIIIYFTLLRPALIEIDYEDRGFLVWLLLSISFVLKTYFSQNYSILNGLGHLGLDKIIFVTVSVLNLFGFYLVLLQGYGLLQLSIVYCSTSIIFAFFSLYLFRKKVPKLDDLHQRQEYSNNLKLSRLWLKMIVLNIVLEDFPFYAGLHKLSALVLAVAGSVTTLIYPFVSRYSNSGEQSKLIKLVKWNYYLSNGIAISFSILLLLAAPYIIPIWLGPNSYLGTSVFMLMLLHGFLYMNTAICISTSIACDNSNFIGLNILITFLTILFSILGGIICGISGVLTGNIVGLLIPAMYIAYKTMSQLRFKFIDK